MPSKRSPTRSSSIKPKLTPYQRFVKRHMNILKKRKDFHPTSAMRHIADLWNARR